MYLNKNLVISFNFLPSPCCCTCQKQIMIITIFFKAGYFCSYSLSSSYFASSSLFRSSRPNLFLEISLNLQENNCARASFLTKLQASAGNFIKKETLAQMFSCEFCEISKNLFIIEHLWWLLLSFHNFLNDLEHVHNFLDIFSLSVEAFPYCYQLLGS